MFKVNDEVTVAFPGSLRLYNGTIIEVRLKKKQGDEVCYHVKGDHIDAWFFTRDLRLQSDVEADVLGSVVNAQRKP